MKRVKRFWGTAHHCLLACALMCALLLAGTGEASECGKTVKLRLSAEQALQGNLLLAEVTTSLKPEAIRGEWDGREIAFWNAGQAKDGSGTRLEGLMGVDLEKPPGEYKVTLTFDAGTAGKETCTASLLVKEGHFATERLQVGKQFVEPDPQQVQRAEEERKRLREIFDTVTPEPLWSGKFRLPLDGMKTGGNFGKRRVLNGKAGSPHTGVDFPSIAGTPIHAAQRGRVVLAENLFFLGNTVVVNHGLGIYTFYGHLSAFAVKAGDDVQVGDLLGKVGATGRVTGPHLHWGLTVERARVNPLEIVRLLGK